VIESCVMGVSANTSIGAPNWAGITADHCARVRVGGTNVAQRNLLASQPAWQMRFFNGVSNVIEGNFIGLAARYPAAHIAPGPGVVFEGGHGNRIGGEVPGARNFLAHVGSWLLDPSLDGAVLLRESHTNRILGNWFGLRPAQTLCVTGVVETLCGLGVHGVSRGVVIENGRENRVGGPTLQAGNVLCGGTVAVDISGTNATLNLVQGNRIGTHPDGTAASTFGFAPAATSANGDGVVLRHGAHRNRIGGRVPGEGNLIANNTGNGVSLWDADFNAVLGNFIGTDITGTNALPNGTFGGGGDGVYLGDGSSENEIGGALPGEGNLISGNHNHGIHLAGDNVRYNRVRGNIIGPDLTGKRRLPYQPPLFPDRGNYLSGVRIDAEASYNQIGGYSDAEGNLISGNGEYGVHIVGISEIGPATGNRIIGNRIGTEITGTAALANALGGVRIQSDGNTVGELILAVTSPPGGDPLPLPWPGASTFGPPGNLISGNGGPGVILDGAQNTVLINRIGTDREGTNALPNATAGVLVRHSQNTIGGYTVPEGNLISGNAGPGVKLATDRATDNTLLRNLIGTDWTGTNALPNAGDGVLVTDDAYNNAIGGLGPNLISGNLGHGIAIIATISFSGITRDTSVKYNRIGTDITGTFALPNASNGVYVLSAPGTLLEGNLISGNAGVGVHLESVTNGTLTANIIGAALDSTTPLPNGSAGVRLRGATGVVIGDPLDPANGNRIAFNAGPGVLVLSTSAGNRIQGNSVVGNAALGINLESLFDPPSGVTPNDTFDADAGANALQNFPAINLALVSGTHTLLQGKLHSTPARPFTIELFRNAAADPSGYGEGDIFVARTNVTTDAAGNATFDLIVPGDWSGWWFTATATDQITGDTSEFSLATVAVPQPRFVFARRDGADFEAGFPTVSGVNYAVLTNANIHTTNWGVYTNLIGTGGTNTFRIPLGTHPRLFFRLRVP
ncbi:MAG: right-handed parallel beta-helix repeat-containing protein, partial [Verrucomicrobiales bacterium]|nr:right-handed parallel beta-helix repeat-containing protein [Verrucomicrobiales bacterium]